MGGRRDVPVHYLRANHTCWSPPVCVFADTETTATTGGDREVHQMRLWHARLHARRGPAATGPGGQQADGDTPQSLASQIDEWTRGRPSVWVFFHNLSFDLAVSRLPEYLAEMGWEVTEIAADARSPFLRLVKGSKHLTVTDSYSWFPVPLASLGAVTGVAKPPLPADGDSREAWLARCAGDTLILATAMLTLMSWWDREQLGRWSITGNQTGWNCFRHTPTPWQILIDPHPERMEAGRACVYGGWRGTSRIGDLPPGRYSELDFERAYTVIARDVPLPWRPMYPFTGLPVDDWRVDNPDYGITAKVLIRTEAPRWPVRHEDRVWYPVGEFWTTLAGPDIADARRRGCLLAIGEGWVHQLGHAMRPWAIRLLNWQADTTGATPDVVKMACKNWGRSVIGKWAQRSFRRTKWGPSPHLGWHFEHAWDTDTGTMASIVDIGGWRWYNVASGDADNAYPEIFAWVEAAVRVRLAAALDVIGTGNVVSWDTDGLIMDMAGRTVPPRLQQVTAPLRMREKTSYRRITVTGPQHLILDGRRRWSGVPSSAHDIGGGKVAATVWPKLAWQMTYGDTSGYVRPVYTYWIRGVYTPAWVLDTGWTVPIETRTSPTGDVIILPWQQTRYHAQGLTLGQHQNTALTGLWEVHHEQGMELTGSGAGTG